MRRCNRQPPDTLLLLRRNPWPQADFRLFDTWILSPLFVHRHSLSVIQTWPSRHQTARLQAAFRPFDIWILVPFSPRRHNLSTLQTLILRYHILPRPEAQTPPHIRFQNVPPCLRSPCIHPSRYIRRRPAHTVRSFPPEQPADNGIPESVLPLPDNRNPSA